MWIISPNFKYANEILAHVLKIYVQRCVPFTAAVLAVVKKKKKKMNVNKGVFTKSVYNHTMEYYAAIKN